MPLHGVSSASQTDPQRPCRRKSVGTSRHLASSASPVSSVLRSLLSLIALVPLDTGSVPDLGAAQFDSPKDTLSVRAVSSFTAPVPILAVQ